MLFFLAPMALLQVVPYPLSSTGVQHPLLAGFALKQTSITQILGAGPQNQKSIGSWDPIFKILSGNTSERTPFSLFGPHF